MEDVKYIIEVIEPPVMGYKFNAKRLISVDGGKIFYYCGSGRFGKTREEAEEYGAQHENEATANN